MAARPLHDQNPEDGAAAVTKVVCELQPESWNLEGHGVIDAGSSDQTAVPAPASLKAV